MSINIFSSISVRFNIIAITCISILLITSSIYDFKVAEKQWNQTWENSLTNSENSLIISLPSALWNFQEEDINSILKATLSNQDIKSIFIKESDKITYGIKKNSVMEYDQSTNIDELNTRATLREIQLFHPEAGDDPIATVNMYTNSDSLTSALNSIINASILKIIILNLIMAFIIYFFMRTIIIKPVKNIAEALKNISQGEGDLTNRITINRRNEIGDLGVYFNKFIEKLHKSMGQVDKVAVNVNHLATDLQEISTDSKDLVLRQKLEIDMVAAAITQMSTTSNEVSNNTNIVSDFAHTASNSANQGRQLVAQSVESITHLSGKIDEATTAMSSLSGEVTGIVSVLNVIRGIAEQTNLLALNAAIEAARAGEQGRGFAVVADEVRALAGRTQDSTIEIQSMIEKLEASTTKSMSIIETGKQLSVNSVQKVNLVNQSLQEVFTSIESITDMTDQIAYSVTEQKNVSEEITTNVNRLATLSTDTSIKVESSTVKSINVNEQSEHLATLMQQFKL